MANGVVVQFAVIAALAVILICLFITLKSRKAIREPSRSVSQVQPPIEKSKNMQQPRAQTAVSIQPPVQEQRAFGTITMDAPGRVELAHTVEPAAVAELAPTVEPAITVEPAAAMVGSPSDAATGSSIATIPKVPVGPVVIDAHPLPVQDAQNQRILAGISENIRKSLIKPVPTYSPLNYPQTPRDTEYVRVKKQIITPHGQIRFSILKDSLSMNMLAVFRRASLDWKSPEDLIGFVPPYLEPQAEILDGQVLLVGTPGHNEKLAIPIRRIDANSRFRDCFDFVTDGRAATNTPAVVVATDTEFEVVSKGVVTHPVIMNPAELNPSEVKLLAEKSPESLPNSLSAALGRG